MDTIFSKKYYNQVMNTQTCGPHTFEKINFSLMSLTQEELKRMWLCHANGKTFASAISSEHPCIITTGFGITGVPHIGTIAQILRAVKLQKSGLPVQIVLGDLDAYNGKTGVSWVKIMSLLPKYRKFICDLGFDASSPSILRTQSKSLCTLRTMYILGQYLTDEMFEISKEDVHDFYSKHQKIDASMTYRMKLSLNLMVADFIDLYYSQKFKAVLVFLGFDEYKYCGLAMNVLKKMHSCDILKDFSLAGAFSSTFKGFYGYPKMGKSFPGSGIDVSMSLPEIEKFLIDGDERCNLPEENVVYQIMQAVDWSTNNELYKLCTKGGINWVTEKKRFAQYLYDIMSLWDQ